MIIFIKAIVVLGLIAFPIIKTYFKGTVNFQWIYGVVFGINFDKSYFRVKKKDESEAKMYCMRIFQFNLGVFNITMAFSIRQHDLETS